LERLLHHSLLNRRGNEVRATFNVTRTLDGMWHGVIFARPAHKGIGRVEPLRLTFQRASDREVHLDVVRGLRHGVISTNKSLSLNNPRVFEWLR
jgi:hypothetical protein